MPNEERGKYNAQESLINPFIAIAYKYPYENFR